MGRKLEGALHTACGDSGPQILAGLLQFVQKTLEKLLGDDWLTSMATYPPISTVGSTDSQHSALNMTGPIAEAFPAVDPALLPSLQKGICSSCEDVILV